MDNIDFEKEYKKTFDNIHASDELKEKVLNLKAPKKRAVSPWKATVGTIAAAVMIFAVVKDYTFKPESDGVISETVVSTQMPEAEFGAAVTVTPDTTTSTEPTRAETSAQKPVATKKPQVSSAKATTAPVTPRVTESVPYESQPTDTVENVENDIAPAMFGLENGRSVGAKSSDGTITRSLDEYFEYIGKNVSSVIPGTYSGRDAFTFTTDENGNILDDKATLSYNLNDGGALTVTISSSPLFGSALDGSVVENEAGINAYKILNGVYYLMHGTGTTCETMQAIINFF